MSLPEWKSFVLQQVAYINKLSIPIGKVELLPLLPRRCVSKSDAGYATSVFFLVPGNRASSSHTTDGKERIIKAGKKSATTIIKIYPKQMVLNKQNVTLSCTPQWKEGGISKLTILLKRK